jgi:hypothetical protein
MTRTKQATSGIAKKLAALLAMMLLFIPATVYADNTARHNRHFDNPNWQAMHHADNWNWMHNWAYHAPEYHLGERLNC